MAGVQPRSAAGAGLGLPACGRHPAGERPCAAVALQDRARPGAPRDRGHRARHRLQGRRTAAGLAGRNRMVRPHWLKVPLLWWWRSLPLRVVLTVFVASVLVLVLGGFLLMQQATIGVIEGKTEAAESVARQVVNDAQQQFNAADQTGDVDADRRLIDLAAQFADQGGGSEQFDAIIRARGQTITAGSVSTTSIPAELARRVELSNDLLITPTEVHYTDDTRASVPGLAAGSTLTLPGTGRYQIYLIFPLAQEVDTLNVLRYAVISTGVILVILLTFIAALVSRQVVNPVRAARRTAESIASGNLGDRMPVRGQDELDRFEALLTDLLEISRFDAGVALLSTDVVDLNDIVSQVLDAHALLARSHGVSITVHSRGEAKAEVDARRIERILRNLVVNAIEHSEGRPIEVLVASDQLAVAVAVRDHGVGFEASQAKQVFHRFWRADPARARTVGGSGLGLAIAMEDANLHGGWLTAWGRPGLGAQFRLTLPRRRGMVLRTSPLPLVPRDLVSTSTVLEPAEPDLDGDPTISRSDLSEVRTGSGRLESVDEPAGT